MFPAILLALLHTAGGAALTLLAVRRATLWERLALGVPAGVAIFGLVGLIFAHVFGLGALALALAALASAAPLLTLRSPERRAQLLREVRRARPRGKWTPGRVLGILSSLALAAVLVSFFRGALYVAPDGSLATTNWSNMGDVAYHVGIIEGFVRGENFPPEHPEFAGARLTYPFLIDFVVAEYVAAGATITGALLVQNLLLIFASVTLLRRMTLSVTGSALAARIVVPIALLSGGWGFLRFLSDALQTEGGLGHLLMNLPRDYTNDPAQGYRWGNMMTVLLGTQRSIMLGIPTGLAIWRLWWCARAESPAPPSCPPAPRLGVENRLMTLAGALCGFLPLGHLHTFLVMGCTAFLWTLVTRRWRLWAPFWITLLAIGVPCVIFMLSQSQTETEPFRRFHPGWDFKVMPDERMSGLSDASIGIFTKIGWLLASIFPWMGLWLKNTGMTIPLLLVAFLSAEEPAVLTLRWRRFYVPILLFFFGANLIQLAPWPWDNIKVLIYWHLAGAISISALLAWMWARRGPWRVVTPVLCVVLTFAGALDVLRVLTGALGQTVYTAEEVKFADAMAKVTPPRSRIVTAPTYNTAAYISGRRVIAGYYGHLWSHGLNSLPREADMKKIYIGDPEADALIRKWKADYLIVGPREREDPKLPINDLYLKKFPVVAQVGEHRLYKLR